MALHGKKYSGDLLGRKYGSNDAFQPLGNVTELKTDAKVKEDTLPSTGREDYGQPIDSEITPEPTTISLKFNTFDKFGLARALMGEAVDLTTAPVTFADESHKVKLGWIDLANDDIDTANFTLKDSTGATVDPTHYELNPRLGMVRFTALSTLASDSTFTVDGKTKGSAGFQIDANTLQSLPLELKLDGKDRITGKDGSLWIPHTNLSSDGSIDWFSDKWWENGFKGTLIKDEGKPTMRFKELNTTA